MLKHYCQHSGCKMLIPSEQKYCEKHKDDENKFWKEEVNKYRSPWAKLYSTKEWRTLRSSYIKEHQECELCGAKATEVHHVIPFGKAETEEEARALCFDADNLQAVCKPCHDRQTVKSMINNRKEN